MDSLAFYLHSYDNDTNNFSSNNFILISPSGITIDSAYCFSNPNFLFPENYVNKFSSYFIRQPENGNWITQYNSALTSSEIFVPIISPITLSSSFKDCVIIAGDIMLSLRLSYQRLQIIQMFKLLLIYLSFHTIQIV